MNGVVVVLQWALALSSLPLAVVSQRCSRAHRHRHARYLAAAITFVTLSSVLLMVSLALWLSNEEPVNQVMSFGLPMLTGLAAALVIRRAIQASRLPRHPRRP
jgi:hypothetical protein